MQNWQADYVRQFPTPEAKAAEIARLEAETKRVDKRTYNGKATRIFNNAYILALRHFNLETGCYDFEAVKDVLPSQIGQEGVVA